MIGTGPSFYSKMVKKWKSWRQIGFSYGGIQLISGWRKVWKKKESNNNNTCSFFNKMWGKEI